MISEGTRKITRTALLTAARAGWLEGVRTLLLAGADPNATSVDTENERRIIRTALHAASATGHSEVVRTLLETGAAVDTLANDGKTALKLALQNGHLETVAVLKRFRQDSTAI